MVVEDTVFEVKWQAGFGFFSVLFKKEDNAKLYKIWLEKKREEEQKNATTAGAAQDYEINIAERKFGDEEFELNLKGTLGDENATTH